MNQSVSDTSHPGYVRFIAYMQVISIILVVVGHSFYMHPSGLKDTSYPFLRIMYSFRMQSFMFVSGFLMIYATVLNRLKGNVSIGNFAWIKVKRLLVPYITLTLVTFFPRVWLNFLTTDQMTLNGNAFWEAFVYRDAMPIPYFWFVHASFLLLISSYIVLKACQRAQMPRPIFLALWFTLMVIGYFTSVSEIQLFSIGEAFTQGPFFVLGMAYAYYFRQIDKIIPWHRWWFLVLCIAAWAGTYWVTALTPWFLFTELAGVATMISFTHVIEHHNVRIFDHLTGANYIIFLLSWYFNVAAQQVLSRFVTLPWQVHTLLSIIFGIYMPWLAYRLMQHHSKKRTVRIAATLLGQNLHPYPKKRAGISTHAK